MLKKLFNNPQILYQTPDSEDMLSEQPIAIHTDASGLIVLEQEEGTILLNKKSVNELCAALKKLK